MVLPHSYSASARRMPRTRRLSAWSCGLWFWLGVATCVLHAANTNRLFNEWFAAQKHLQRWSADFTQTRSLKVLAQPLVAPGHVWVTPHAFRWELGQPVQTIVLRQPNQLLIIYPQLKRVEEYPLAEVPPGPLKDTLALLDATLPRDRASLEKHFRLRSAVETNALLQITLEPKSAAARQFIREIVIGVHTNNFQMAMTEMRFADGSTLRNDFTHLVVNPPLPAKLFQMKLPPDFTVVDPLKKQ